MRAPTILFYGKMYAMLTKLTRPYIFAHRGASAHAPENTLAAFELAFRQGAQAIEFDVKLTADRQVIIHHDRTLERTTNGSGPVAEHTLAELRALDAGGWFSEQYRGEKIPTLEEVFEALGGKIFMNVELTNYATPGDGLVDEVAQVVKRQRMEEGIMFSSFSAANLARARRLLPGVACGYLLDGGAPWRKRLEGSFIRMEAEHPWMEDATAAAVEKAHRRGRRMHVWTVNEAAEMRRLRSIGVDGIFTDDPPLGLDVFVNGHG